MSMDRDEVNRAIEQLRMLHRRAAAELALDCAARLLPTAARYNTPADLAALGLCAR